MLSREFWHQQELIKLLKWRKEKTFSCVMPMHTTAFFVFSSAVWTAKENSFPLCTSFSSFIFFIGTLHERKCAELRTHFRIFHSARFACKVCFCWRIKWNTFDIANIPDCKITSDITFPLSNPWKLFSSVIWYRPLPICSLFFFFTFNIFPCNIQMPVCKSSRSIHILK